MARIYLETSFIDACVTHRSDAGSVWRNDVSCEWWAVHRPAHDVYISAQVVAELAHEQQRHRELALDFIADLEWLPINKQVRGLANLLVQEGVFPGPVIGDAVHVAAAAVHRADYMLSWDIRHLASVPLQGSLAQLCLRAGLLAPRILTCESLWKVDHE